MDTESLKKNVRRRPSSLDICLVTSVSVLLVTVTVVSTGGLMMLLQLRDTVQSTHQVPQLGSGSVDRLSGDTPNPAYKMQKFAYLESTQGKLENATMSWADVPYGAGTSVGSNFLFNKVQHSLRPKREGMYFMYLNLNLSCTHTCNAGLLAVHLGDKLTCGVHLPANSTHVSRKCWTVSWMDGELELLAQMVVPKEGLTDWKLESTGSSVGMFLVD